MKSKTTKLWIAGGIMAAAFMTAATLQTDYITADAKAKKQETNSTVTYKVKGSTLTIKGSGSMSASMIFDHMNEIWQQKENQKDQKGRCKERCHNYFSQCV